MEGEIFIRESKKPPRYVFDESEQTKRISSLTTSIGPVGVFPFVDVPPDELLAERDGGVEESGKTKTTPPLLHSSTPPPAKPGAKRPKRSIVLLHGVQDPGNVGTIIRSAHAFGAGVALSVGCADLYNPKTVRGTMGAIFHVPISREVSSVDFLEAASGYGFTSVAAMPKEGKPSRSLPDGKLVVVVGSEGSGLPEEVAGGCEVRMTIPSEAASLNAAVAASILLYEAHSRVLT